MIKKTFVFAVFSLLFTLVFSELFAQVEISGKVLDELNKEPLVGVNVVIKGTSYGTASDRKGRFWLRANVNIPCKVQLSMIGYKTHEFQITKRTNTNLEIGLSELTIMSGEVVVRAKEIEVEEKTMKQLVSVEMLDMLSIRETPASNFYEAISHLKGVDVVMQSMQFMTVNARGFNSTENTRFVQVVDGMDNQAPGMSFPIGNIAGLSELDVESIEFLPGPAEVQYGGNALNGILLMKSKDPFRHQGTSIYFKPGISDVKPGSDYPFQFSGKSIFEGGIRIAEQIGERFAFKLNASYVHGRDWYADDTTNIRPGNIKWEPDPGHDAINKYGDEVTSDLGIGPRGQKVIVSRSGYKDKDLMDNRIENLKLSGSVHYKIGKNTIATLHGNYGNVTTAYTGDNRTSLVGFKIYQGKFELQGSHFQFRAYSSMQNSGKSYDAKFLAVHLNEYAKSDEKWFHEFYQAFSGGYRKFGVLSRNPAIAREYADRSRLIPGSPEFEEQKQIIINNPDFRYGAGIKNNSSLHNVDALFDLDKYTGNTKVKFGGNYRFYDLESGGTIFPDTLGNDITYYEYGAFVEAQRKFLNNHLSIKASLRYDKSENFEAHLSPRVSVMYEINEDNIFRASILTGFRNPGVKEQFINKDLGTARYLGGLHQILENYKLPLNSIYLDKVNEFNAAVDVDVNDVSNPYGPDQALYKNLDILEAGIVGENEINHLKPEQVLSFEIGFKTKIADVLFLDAVYYNSVYKDFIGISKVVKTRTSPAVNMIAAASQINKSSQNELFFVNVNAQELVGIHGFSMGYKWLMPMGSIISGNFTLSGVKTSVNDPVSPGFNTPGFKSNLSLSNRHMDRMENNPGFRNLGFKITWRLQSRYYWESTFGNGYVRPVGTMDVQFSLNLKNPKAILKVGASNFFNNSYAYSFGGSNVGILYYMSYTIDNIFNI